MAIPKAYCNQNVPPGEVGREAEEYLARCPVCNDANISFQFWGKSRYHNHWYKYSECANCSLVFMNPQIPVATQYARVKNEEHLSSFYVSKIPLDRIEFKHNIVAPTSKLIPPKAANGGSRKWLDVGCAVGNLLEVVNEWGYDPYGLELNQSMVNWIRNNRSYITVYQGSVEVLPKGECYDVISMDNVLEHITNPFEFLTEIAEHLTPESVLIIRVPNYNTIFRYLYAILGRLQESIIIDPDAHPCNHSFRSLKTLLERCRMSIIRKNENLMISYALRHILAKIGHNWSDPIQRVLGYAYSCCFPFDKIMPRGGIDITVFAEKSG